MGAHRRVLLLVGCNRDGRMARLLVQNTANGVTLGCVYLPSKIGFHPVRRKLSDGQKRTEHVG